jgi:virginiamycin B lyase
MHGRTGAFLIVLLAALIPPASAAGQAIQEFPIPAGSHPGGITAGPDGALWFVAEGTNRIHRMTTAGVLDPPAGFPVDITGTDTTKNALDQITTGPDGALWFTQPRDNQIARIPTAGGPITEFPLTIAGSAPDAITVGPDNNLWFTAPGINQVGRMDLGGNQQTWNLPVGAVPTDIAAGPDGRVWFTESLGNQIGAISPATGTITHYSSGLTPLAEPSGITQGPGGSLWFTESSANQIGQITTTGTISEYPGAAAGPSAIGVGRDGALWFTESEGNSIGRITTSGSITNRFGLPNLGSEPSDITPGPDGSLWFSERGGDRIGRIATTPPPPLPPPPPPPILQGCTVPKLVGLSTGKAKRRLRKAGCKFRFSGKGFVVSSSPRAGRRTILIVQVKARQRCTVPKVAGLSVKKAKKKLRRARCRFRVKGSGQVVSTSPRAGKRTTKTVQVKASRRPPR